MKALTLIGLIWSVLSFAPAHALTIDEIIKLKKAGVSDSTIELMIERDGSPRAAGTWRTRMAGSSTRPKCASLVPMRTIILEARLRFSSSRIFLGPEVVGVHKYLDNFCS